MIAEWLAYKIKCHIKFDMTLKKFSPITLPVIISAGMLLGTFKG